MKRLKMMCLGLLGAALCSPAMAGTYLSVGVGPTYNDGSAYRHGLKSDYDTSAMYSVAVGYELPVFDLLRVEGEYLHNRAELSKNLGKTTLDAAMANAYVNIPFPVPLLTPYVGAGIGYARFESSNRIAYQGMIGLDAEIFVIPVVGSLEYRYTELNSPATRQDEKYKYYGHTIMAKVRYEF